MSSGPSCRLAASIGWRIVIASAYAGPAASAGLTSDEARGMSLGEIAAHKFSRDDTD
jgi:hypothetical protein